MSFLEPTLPFMLSLLAAFTIFSMIVRFGILRRHKKTGRIMIITRLLSIGLLVILLFYILGSFEKVENPSKEKEPLRRTLLLVDKSQSMQYSDGNSTSRAYQAQQTSEEFHAAVEGKDFIKLEEMHFADQAVDLEKSSMLSARHSKLHKAFFTALQRRRPEKIVILSDGAATDSALAPHQIQWARNAGLEVFSILMGDADKKQIDLMCTEPEAEIRNPKTISCLLRQFGNSPVNCQVRLEIDGRTVAVRQESFDKEKRISFRLDPEMKPGWHEYRVSIDPQENEVTTDNNFSRGAFEKTRVEKNLIIFVSRKARVENRVFKKAFQQSYEEFFQSYQIDDNDLKNVDPDAVKLLIVADIGPNELPVQLHKVFTDRKVCILFLASKKLNSWRAQHPVQVLREEVIKEGKPLQIDGALSMFKSLEGLKTRRFYSLVSTGGMLPLLTSKNGRHHLLLADKAKTPGRLVFLVEDSWRWQRSADDQIRRSFTTMLDDIVGLSYPEQAQEGNIYLTMENQREAGRAVFEAGFNGSDPSVDLVSMQLNSLKNSESKSFKMKKISRNHFRFIYTYEDDASLTWFTASAMLKGKREKSERVPLVIKGNNPDLEATLPRPEILKNLATSDKHFYSFEDRKAVIESLTKKPEELIVKGQKNNRNHWLELIFCLLLVALWIVETTVERRSIEEKLDA